MVQNKNTDETALRQMVMVVDDEPDMLSMLKMVLGKQCSCDVSLAQSGKAALEQLAVVKPDVVITDIMMPDLDGLNLLKKILRFDQTISVIIMTGYGTIQMATQALKDGAYDFLEKPFNKNHIVQVTRHCLERTKLLKVNRQLQEQLKSGDSSCGYVGQSAPLKNAIDLIHTVADKDVTVLVRGESGTGKELAARALHSLSRRRDKKMIIVNCPAVPEHLLESELFGYRKGAFTGADQDKKGLFEEADNSTILLDEIGDIPIKVQTKLLRVLQEKEIQPLGQNDSIKVNVRVVASTNQDLEAKIASGDFREDLFYRINLMTITMPSLLEMKEDIPLLAHHFLNRFRENHDRPDLSFSQDALKYLYQREWPGNIREFKNVIERAVLLARCDTINHSLLTGQQPNNCHSTCPTFEGLTGCTYKEAKAVILKNFNVDYLSELLAIHDGNVTLAAQNCGLDRQALQRIMRRYSIKSSDFKEK